MAKEDKKVKKEESNFEEVALDGQYKVVETAKVAKSEIVTAMDFLIKKDLFSYSNEIFVNKKYANELKTEEEWNNLFKKDKLIK